jgi:hypothetical protein
MTIGSKDLEDLRRAVGLLENPGFIARVTDFAGQPIEKLMDFLPSHTSAKIQDAVKATLSKLLSLSVKTMDGDFSGPSSTVAHKIATGLSGVMGGAFGLPALGFELPVSTSIILRSIADIARSEGEDITSLETKLACLEVFALGGRSEADDGAETGYFAMRAALAKAVSDAAKHIAQKGLTTKGAPVIARFIALLTSRFGAVLSQKIAVQAVPVIGAVGGATINLLFVGHFQDIARGHFIVRRLEREYGKEDVQKEYEKIRRADRV